MDLFFQILQKLDNKDQSTSNSAINKRFLRKPSEFSNTQSPSFLWLADNIVVTWARHDNESRHQRERVLHICGIKQNDGIESNIKKLGVIPYDTLDN